jgi:hypothetical protein
MGLPASLLLAKSAGNIGAAGILTDGSLAFHPHPATDHSGGTAADFHGLPPTLPRLRNFQIEVYARLLRVSNFIASQLRAFSLHIKIIYKGFFLRENFSAVFPLWLALFLHRAQPFLRIFQPVQLVQKNLD